MPHLHRRPRVRIPGLPHFHCAIRYSRTPGEIVPYVKLSTLMYPVDIKCHVAIAFSRHCKTGCLCRKPDFRFLESKTGFRFWFWIHTGPDVFGAVRCAVCETAKTEKNIMVCPIPCGDHNYVHVTTVTCARCWSLKFGVRT